MKQNSKIIISLIIMVLVFSFVIIPVVQAETGTGILAGLTKTVGYTDLKDGTTDLPAAIGKIIQILLGFLGVLAVVLIIYAGFLWMTAGGDSAKTAKSKDWIKNAVIGLVIILASYIITSYVIDQISDTLTSTVEAEAS